MLTLDTLRDKLQTAQVERDAFVRQANAEVDFRNGQINQLEQLIALLEAPATGQTQRLSPPQS